MAEEQEQVKASERYLKTLEGYKMRLASEPDLSLKNYCKEIYTDYHRFIHWCSRHKISLIKARKEALSSCIPSISSQDSKDPELFVQFRPALPTSVSCPIKGVSITFPDGINLTLQECHIEELIALLDIYQQRKGNQKCSV